MSNTTCRIRTLRSAARILLDEAVDIRSLAEIERRSSHQRTHVSSGAKTKAADSRFCPPGVLSDSIEGLTKQISSTQHVSLLRGQAGHGRLHAPKDFCALNPPAGRRVASGQRIDDSRRGSIRVLRSPKWESRETPFSTTTLFRITNQVVGDGFEPTAEGLFVMWVEGGNRSSSAYKRLLQHVVCPHQPLQTLGDPRFNVPV
jgi:hypothetical protein